MLFDRDTWPINKAIGEEETDAWKNTGNIIAVRPLKQIHFMNYDEKIKYFSTESGGKKNF